MSFRGLNGSSVTAQNNSSVNSYQNFTPTAQLKPYMKMVLQNQQRPYPPQQTYHLNGGSGATLPVRPRSFSFESSVSVPFSPYLNPSTSTPPNSTASPVIPTISNGGTSIIMPVHHTPIAAPLMSSQQLANTSGNQVMRQRLRSSSFSLGPPAIVTHQYSQVPFVPYARHFNANATYPNSNYQHYHFVSQNSAKKEQSYHSPVFTDQANIYYKMQQYDEEQQKLKSEQDEDNDTKEAAELLLTVSPIISPMNAPPQKSAALHGLAMLADNRNNEKNLNGTNRIHKSQKRNRGKNRHRKRNRSQQSVNGKLKISLASIPKDSYAIVNRKDQTPVTAMTSDLKSILNLEVNTTSLLIPYSYSYLTFLLSVLIKM